LGRLSPSENPTSQLTHSATSPSQSNVAPIREPNGQGVARRLAPVRRLYGARASDLGGFRAPMSSSPPESIPPTSRHETNTLAGWWQTCEEAARLTVEAGPHGEGTGILLSGIIFALEHVLANRDAITATTTTSDLIKAHIQPVTMPQGWTAVPEVINAANSWYTHHYIEDATGKEQLKENGNPDPPPGTCSFCAKLAANPETAHFVGRPTHFLSHAHTYRVLDTLDAMRAFVATLPPEEVEKTFFWFDGFVSDTPHAIWRNLCRRSLQLMI
jgi:hypothetical protein